MQQIKNNLNHLKSAKVNFKKIDLSKKLNEIKGFSINYSNKLIDDLIEALIISIKIISQFKKFWKF